MQGKNTACSQEDSFTCQELFSRWSQDLSQPRKPKCMVCNSTSDHKIEPRPQSLQHRSLVGAGAPELQLWDRSVQGHPTIIMPYWYELLKMRS